MANEINSVSSAVIALSKTPTKVAEMPDKTEAVTTPAPVPTKPQTDQITLSAKARMLTAADSDTNAQRPTPAMANLMKAFLTTSDMEGFNAESDLNADGIINFQDLAALRDLESGAGQGPRETPEAMIKRLQESFLSWEGEKDFDLTADQNSDGVINFQDLALLRSLLDET